MIILLDTNHPRSRAKFNQSLEKAFVVEKKARVHLS